METIDERIALMNTDITKSLETIDERITRIERELCWYPFSNCNTKAETKAKDPIGSDPMQYCKKHDAAMRQRYAKEAK